MSLKLIKNRNGDMVAFDANRIRIALLKAFVVTYSLNVDINEIDNVKNENPNLEDSHGFVDQDMDAKIDEILDGVVWELEKIHNSDEVVSLEHIQDIVEKELMKKQEFAVAKEYIIYRQKQNEKRKLEKMENQEKIEHNNISVIKNDGSKQKFEWRKIQRIFDLIAKDLSDKCLFEDFKAQISKYIIDNITTKDIYKLMLKASIDLISVDNIHRQMIAGRVMNIELYKKTARDRKLEFGKIYSPESFLSLAEEYVGSGLYYADFFKHYSKEDFLTAGEYVKSDRDFTYGCTTMQMLLKRYLLNPNKIHKELPQHFYMAVAMFLAVPEKAEERLDIAFQIYDIISTQKLSLATPCLMNSRRKFHQLASCFKLSVDDDLRSIYHNIENVAQISKFGGGVWVYLGHVRSKWASIRWVKWVSGGVVPWIKVINDTAIAVNQLWARAGAVSVTLDVRHRDIFDYLSMQTETGDMRRKCFDIFPSVSIPDIFMQRVESDMQWTTFDPYEIYTVTWQRLQDLYGDDFSRFYIECENNSKIELKEKTDAKELFKTFLKSVVETGMPYVFFRDTVNSLNPNKHCGMVYSTQLCTEIAQNMSSSKFVTENFEDWTINIKYKPGDTVVCNLASINVAKVRTDEEMQKVIPLSMRVLDNVIDMNYYPLKEAELTSKKYRPVWLWFLGLAEHLATDAKVMFDSVDAVGYVDGLFEKYAYRTIRASVDLAKVRWKYELFDGSEWSKWIIMWKNKQRFENNSKLENQSDSILNKKNWSDLIDDMMKFGTRFGYHLSPAPNTSTANVVGTTAGVLPIYKKYFVYTDAVAPSVNVAPRLDKTNQRYYKEYVNSRMPAIIDVVSTIQKRIDQAISFERIINPADTSPKDLYDYYFYGRKKWLKTVYYVRSMSLEAKECVSCSG